MMHRLGKKALRDLERKNYYIDFAWIDKQTHGTIEGDAITLNIVLMLAEIYIHEWLHNEDPNPLKTETEIWDSTQKLLDCMTRGDIEKIGNQLLKRLFAEGISR